MTGALSHLPPDLAPNFTWIDAGPVCKVIAALERAEAGSARFVGGCIRDSLLGLAPKDVDIATQLTPDRVTEALTRARLGVAPTGLDHGTVTAIADHRGVEITTLRADVSTDGRRAVVAFTRDWGIDAQRRDFTINALYLTPDRRLYDPTGGMRDLARRSVRFIGAPEDRIREDFLRILRFFRFSARFAANFDEIGLVACGALKEGLRQLSAERVGDEMTKLLALETPQAAISAMNAIGVLREIWPASPQIETLARLKSITPDAAPPIALAALYGAAGDGVDARLRLSNAQGVRRRNAIANAALLDRTLSEREARALLYRMGAENWRDACLLAEAIATSGSETPQGRDPVFRTLAELPDRWTPPKFPCSGKDALALGVPEGPFVAQTIRATEMRWITEDFPPAARARAIFEEEAARAISRG